MSGALATMTAEAGGASLTAAFKPPLLYLCHRMPYPPNKGDKIRSWHLLKFLAQRYSVYLGTFVDDPEDWVHAPKVRQLCAGAFFAPLSPKAARVRSLTALLTDEALSLPYYANKGLMHWAAKVSDAVQIKRRVVFSSVMGQFLPPAPQGARTLVDFVDVDSDKWRQYAALRRGPAAWIYARESRLLEQHESALAHDSDAALFVSAAEAEFFRARVAGPEVRCGYFSNGVDAQYFDPAAIFENPCSPANHSEGEPELVFTGAMDYWPNVDAVHWFAREVLPLLRREMPTLRFTIVGGKPAPAVRELAALPGVTVTGRVVDVRPFIARALAVVAPMRVARGVQNKVLEAMAMAKPVLVSSMGLEGIDAVHGDTVLVANDADEYLRSLRHLEDGAGENIGQRARALVATNYAWNSCLSVVEQHLEEPL